jgi:transposase
MVGPPNSNRTIYRIISAYLAEGRVDAKPCGGQKPQLLNDEHKEAIRSYINDDCTITLETIRQRLMDTFGVQVSIASIHRAINGFSYTLKSISPTPERRNDEVTIYRRHDYASSFFHLLTRCDEAHIFFLDEVGFNVSMRSKRGRALRGQSRWFPI